MTFEAGPVRAAPTRAYAILLACVCEFVQEDPHPRSTQKDQTIHTELLLLPLSSGDLFQRIIDYIMHDIEL